MQCLAFRYKNTNLFLSVVVDYPDLLLMYSLFVTDKEFVHYVLDIVSVFASKLHTDDWAPFNDS